MAPTEKDIYLGNMVLLSQYIVKPMFARGGECQMDMYTEREKLIEQRPNGPTLIRGVPGSGKTLLGLRRAAFLSDHYCRSFKEEILFVTRNALTAVTAREYWEELRRESPRYYSFFRSEDPLTITDLPSLLSSYLPDSEAARKKPGDEERRTALTAAWNDLPAPMQQQDLLQAHNYDFLLEEISWIKAENIASEGEYQQANRFGRTGSPGSAPQKLRKDSEERAAIFALSEAYAKRLKMSGYMDDWERDLVAMAAAEEKFLHIIVDDAEILTKTQLLFLKRLYMDREYGSFTLLTNISPSPRTESWLVKGRNYTELGWDMTGRSHILWENFAATREAARTAFALIEGSGDFLERQVYLQPDVALRSRSFPVCRVFDSAREEERYVIRRLRNAEREKFDSLALICLPARRDYWQQILGEANILALPINQDYVRGGYLPLVTPEEIAGLHFTEIFLPEINLWLQSVLPSSFYPVFLAARMEIHLSGHGKRKWMTSLPAGEFLRMRNNSLFRHYYAVPWQNYSRSERPFYDGKEHLRQWLADQLQRIYGYPAEEISFHYKMENDIFDLAVHRAGELIILAQVFLAQTGIPGSLTEFELDLPCCLVHTDGIHSAFYLNGRGVTDIPIRKGRQDD